MKTNKSFTKILAFLVTMMVMVGMMSVPVMAETYSAPSAALKTSIPDAPASTDAFYNLSVLTGTVNAETGGAGKQLSFSDFKTAFNAANVVNKGVMTFEGISNLQDGSSATKYDVMKIPYAYGESVLPITKNPVWVRYSSSGAVYSSGGTSIVIKGVNTSFTIGDILDNDADVDAYEPNENEKVTSLCFALLGLTGDAKVTATYSNGETLTLTAKMTEGAATTNAFIGFEAPEGAYISKIDIVPANWITIDDLGFITKVVEPVIPTTVEVSDKTVEAPAYNAKASYDLDVTVKDQKNSEIIDAELNWQTSDSSATVEDGVLTLKRTNGTALPPSITVTATSADNAEAVGSATITITSVDPYLRSDRIGSSSLNDYTKADFLKDLAKSENIAVINFEDDAHTHTVPTDWTLNTVSATTAISGTSGNVIMSITKPEGYNPSNKRGYILSDNAEGAGYASGNKGITLVNQYGYTFEFNVNGNDELKPTAIGWAVCKVGGGNVDDHKVKAYFSNGKTADYTADLPTAIDTLGFAGVKAPAGEYITKIEIGNGNYSVLDDFVVVLENPANAEPVFSKDANNFNVIEKLADISSSDIYVTIPANAQATGKLILAIYDENGLLDVNAVDESVAQAMVTVPSGKTVAKIKMFVWDSLTGLSPLEGKAVTINN